MDESQDQSTKQNTRVLSNGAVYDLDKKRIVKGATLSSAEAASLANKRAEIRREVARVAANEAVERGDYVSRFGDFAFVAAIIETAMYKATSADDPKAIEAARFVLDQTGESIKESTESAVPLDSVRGLIREIAAAALAINARESVGAADVIDAESAA